jgi:hypothetical protein
MKKRKIAPPPVQGQNSKLPPLTWIKWNGCQETDPAAMRKNFALCPAKTAEEFVQWLNSLPHNDQQAWFKGIGWVEGYVYCQEYGFCIKTAWPGLQKHPPGVNTYLTSPTRPDTIEP